MVGEIIEHIRFGRGTVTAFDPPRMEVRFEGDDNQVRRFSYPAGVAKFIHFVDPDAAQRAQDDLARSNVLQRQEVLERIEQNRRREEQIAEQRLESARKKRSDAAKKAAERRRIALATRNK